MLVQWSLLNKQREGWSGSVMGFSHLRPVIYLPFCPPCSFRWRYILLQYLKISGSGGLLVSEEGEILCQGRKKYRVKSHHLDPFRQSHRRQLWKVLTGSKSREN